MKRWLQAARVQQPTTVHQLMAVMLATTLVASCASKPQVPVRRVIQPAPDSYVVNAGDTVGEIATRYGLDYQEIGRINNLDANYTIYPNQRLRLKERPPRVEVRQPTNPAPVAPIKSQSLSTPAPVKSTTTVAKPIAPTATTVQPKLTPPPPVVAPVNTNNSGTMSAQGWQWPTQNPIIQEFNPSQHVKGMRFSGKIGDSVRAVADGEVVYANNGLKEYGNLVLIRHLNGYISAYAHNSRLLVREGERVRLGQTIAEIGESGTSQVMLELQIRANGKPINPRGVLPTR